MCNVSLSQQEKLLPDGDGSQVLCEHMLEENDGDETQEYAMKKPSEQEKVDVPVDNDEEMVCNFPDDNDDAEVNAIPWRDVDMQTWLRVVETRTVNTVNGKATIVVLHRRDGTQITAWTTKLIATNIATKQLAQGDKNLFIKSIGKKQSKLTKNFYHDFRIKML